MSIITIFSGKYCNTSAVEKNIAEQTNYTLLTDDDITNKAVQLSGISKSKIEKVFSMTKSVFNKYTHEHEKALAYLKLALAEIIKDNNLIISGMSAQLISRNISHVLRLCLISDLSHRIANAEKQGASKEKAEEEIKEIDAVYSLWVDEILMNKDPWDPALYDILIPIDKVSENEISALVKDNLSADVIKPTEASKKAEIDFELASKIEIELLNKGHIVDVSARDGLITLSVKKNVIFLSKLENELKQIVSLIPGVKSVETRVSKGFYKNDIYRNFDFELPQKVLLVDDEREFVKTLSDRLLMRDMGSAIAYDGESALNLLEDEEPEVMILDLRMPGIDGIEVLKKVKETKPQIEVIILTGHGSEKDKEVCMNLGAFAYLQKPVNIELLSETLKKAYDKNKSNKKSW